MVTVVTLDCRIGVPFTLRNGETVVIRKVRRSDGELIRDFFLCLSETTRRLFQPSGFDYFTAEAIAAEADSPHNYQLIAVSSEGRVVGCACWRCRNFNRHLPIVSIVVADSHQNIGLGRQLMNFLIKSAQQRGKRGLELSVLKENERAIRLYNSLGFCITGDTDYGRQHVMRLEFEPQRQRATFFSTLKRGGLKSGQSWLPWRCFRLPWRQGQG